MLKFSGVIPAADGGFIGDGGAATIGDTPLAYPVSNAKTARRLSVRLLESIGEGEEVIVQLLKNGLASALTLTFTGPIVVNSPQALEQISAVVAYADGDAFDLRGLNGSALPVPVSATVAFDP